MYGETSGEWETAYNSELGEICAFDISFDNAKLYFAVTGCEGIFYTENAGNISLEDVVPTAEFYAATQSRSSLALYTARENANAYSVTEKDGAFLFNGIVPLAEEYPLIAEIDVTDNLTLYALASVKGVVLINEKDLAYIEYTVIADAPQTVYVTPAVFAYALPVISENHEFALSIGGGKLRLNYGETLTVTEAFTVLNKTFYAAYADLGDGITEFYVPADWTAETIATDMQPQNYTFGTVKKTALSGIVKEIKMVCATEKNDLEFITYTGVNIVVWDADSDCEQKINKAVELYSSLNDYEKSCSKIEVFYDKVNGAIKAVWEDPDDID